MNVAFDLEIAKEVEGDDWSQFRPFGITCAALRFEDGVSVVEHGGKGLHNYAPCMTSHHVRKFIARLWAHRNDWTIITVNGLGFDFDVLAEESQDTFFTEDNERYHEACVELAMNHIDIGFQMFCERGFMIGLNAMAQALGLPGKTEGMSGDKAPTLWAQGQEEKVLEYVEQDVITTLDVYEEIPKQRKVRWITKAGTPAKYPWEPEIRDGRLLTVRECLELPLPDTSWMDEPWEREKFYGWTKPE